MIDNTLSINNAILSMPKFELHVHLGGMLSSTTARALARRHNIDLGDIFTPVGGYIADTFDKFLTNCDKAFEVIRTEEDYALVVSEYLEKNAKLGTLYTEIFVSPVAAELSGIGYRQCLAGLIKGIRDAEESYGIVARVIPIAERHLGPIAARQASSLALQYLVPEVVGFGMAGDERLFNIREFKPAFDQALEAGLALTCHAGEICGPESIRETLDTIEVQRIGHGVRAVEDRNLIDRLIDQEIVLEICPSSNVLFGIFDDLRVHPARSLLENGVKITISTDDPEFFDTDMNREYTKAHQNMGFSLCELAVVSENGLNAAFCDLETKKRLRKMVLM